MIKKILKSLLISTCICSLILLINTLIIQSITINSLEKRIELISKTNQIQTAVLTKMKINQNQQEENLTTLTNIWIGTEEKINSLKKETEKTLDKITLRLEYNEFLDGGRDIIVKAILDLLKGNTSHQCDGSCK